MFAQILTHQEISWINIFNALGLAGLYLFAFGAYLSPPLSALGLGLMFIALILRLPKIPSIWRDPLFIVSLAFAVYLVFRTITAIGELPETRIDQIDKALDLFRLGYFFTVVSAFWLASNPRRIYPVLLLSLTGLLTRIIINIKITDLYDLLASRPGFGMPANAFGLYAAVVVLGLLLLAPQFWGPLQNRRFFLSRVMFWVIILSVFMEGLIVSQSRGSYLGCLIVFPPLLSVKLLSEIKSDSEFSQKRIAIVAVIIFLFMATFFVSNKNMINRPFISELESLKLLIAGKAADMPFDGIKVRYEAWRLGTERWLQRPFLGWGPGSSAYLINQSKIESIRKGSGKGTVLKDFHNSYFETLVQIGLVGAIFFAVSLWLVLKSAWEAYRSGWIRLEIFLFTLGALLLFLITTSFNLRTRGHLGRHHLILFSGIAYAYRYHQMLFLHKVAGRAAKQN